jgi:hypothetical protein
MNENPLLVGLELEDKRSVIADNVDVLELKSRDTRDNFWVLLDKVGLPPANPVGADSK